MNRSPGTWQWDDVRFFLAVARTGSLSAAARALGVGHVTVGRRIALFEARLGVTLLNRTPDGTIAMSLKALAVGGHVSLIGASLSSSGTGLDPLLLTGRGITLGSISVGSRADFEAMNRAIALHRLRPAIDRTFPFAEAKAAYRYFEGRGHFGKVVISHG